ncbi:MAG: hypothetical protein CMH31_02945 [Micavibrio sp.]|nr:hypothetical protein [Micavibrio sp.]
MVKIKGNFCVMVLSALLGLMVVCAPFLNSSFAEESALAEKNISKVDTKLVQPVKEAPMKKATNFNKTQNKEKIKTEVEALPQSIETKASSMSVTKNEQAIEKFDEYVLGPEDKLKINVFGEKELSGDYRVGSEGSIAFPLIGDINVEGLTLRQAEEAIKVKLRQGYLKKPSVSIEIAESRPFYILGEVRRPGSYNYIAGMSVLQAVAISGGFTYRANRKSVEILRGNEAPAEPMNTTTSEKVKPGDIIFIQERLF